MSGLSEQDREALRSLAWQTLADHQWRDWSCSCGQVDPASREYEDNHLADVAADALSPEVEQIAERRAAEAWDGGYRSGFSNAMRRMSDEPNAPTTPNPYCRCGTLTDLGGPGPHHDDCCPLDRAALDGGEDRG